MPTPVQRHHWVSTYVGVLDQAFWLSDEELFAITDIMRTLLTWLHIPDRNPHPLELPLPVAHEVQASYFSRSIEARQVGQLRQARLTRPGEGGASLEAWREALVLMLVTAYPDITPQERLGITKTLTDLLDGLGLPRRAAAYHPDMVLKAHQHLDTLA